MDCPKYANAFTVTYNSSLKEVVINFIHEYPIVENPAQKDPATGQIQTNSGRENVSGIVLPEETTRQLLAVIEKALSSN